jgi:hypothetical protein
LSRFTPPGAFGATLPVKGRVKEKARPDDRKTLQTMIASDPIGPERESLVSSKAESAIPIQSKN